MTPPTSYTIGIDSVEGTADRTRRATGYEVLKIKVGGPGDLERLRAVRAETAARLRIDGNEGWDLDTARELTPELIELGVEFVEQPFPAQDLDAFHALPRASPRLPVLIDEGCRDLRSVAPIAAYADGIVIKLSKCGGIREALRMIHAARALDLKVMLGCMIESELGIAQAAQLGSLADYIDLDGHLLISSQPFDRARPARRAAGALRRPRAGRRAAVPDRLALFTGGQFAESHAKTAHGILRYARPRGRRGRRRRAGRAGPRRRSSRTRAATVPIVASVAEAVQPRRERAGDRRRAVRRRADAGVARGAAGGDAGRDARRGRPAHRALRGPGAGRGGRRRGRRAARPARRAARA